MLRCGFAFRHILSCSTVGIIALACSSGTLNGDAEGGSGGTGHEGGGGFPTVTGGAASTSGGGSAAAGGANAGGGNGSDTGGAASGGSGPITSLRHPGILHSADELTFIKMNLEAGTAPFEAAMSALQASHYASLSYQEVAYASVQCGSYNMPNVGCSQIVDDGMAAYSHALLWALSGEQENADKAMSILKAWSDKYEENTESNARLVVAWAAPWYANAGELLRYTGAGWPETEQASFTALLDKFLPYILDDERPENNWIQSRIEAHFAIAVFNDDAEELAAAVERWNFWLPIYLYQTTDGPAPVNPPGRTASQTLSIWKSDTDQLVFRNGLAMETCRDLGHLGLGFGSMMYAAETAWQQGIDLFSPNQKRLTDFMELHGSWMTGSAAVPSDVCDGVVKLTPSSATGISPPAGGGRQVWEIAVNHLSDRLGVSLPHSVAMRDAGRPSGAGRWVAKWSTLTHGAREF